MDRDGLATVVAWSLWLTAAMVMGFAVKLYGWAGIIGLGLVIFAVALAYRLRNGQWLN